MDARPELVRQVPQRIIEVAGDGQLRVRLEQVDRAERLRRDLRNLLARDSVRTLTAADWLAAVRDSLEENAAAGEPAAEGKIDGATAAAAAARPSDEANPPPPPPPRAPRERGEVDDFDEPMTMPPPLKPTAAGGWIHLDRCRILDPAFR